MDKPTKAQEDYAKSISAALGIPLPSMKTKQSYSEFISMYVESFKKAPAAYVINGDLARGQIVLSFAKIPKNCGDCRLYLDSENYDEDTFFGDGLKRCCPFGASTMNCMNTRPWDCPIKKIKQDFYKGNKWIHMEVSLNANIMSVRTKTATIIKRVQGNSRIQPMECRSIYQKTKPVQNGATGCLIYKR